MGIWSRPLFTRCTDKANSVVRSDRVVLSFSEDDACILSNLSNHSTDVTEGDRTFEEAIMATCDTAKIWGYFDKVELHSWELLFSRLMDQNPHVHEAEAHFYCIDSHFPYVIYKERGGPVRIQHGTDGHCLYCNLDFGAEEGEEWKFDKDMYRMARDGHDSVFWNAMEEYCDISLLMRTGQCYPR